MASANVGEKSGPRRGLQGTFCNARLTTQVAQAFHASSIRLTALQAVMFGIMLALTPSLVTLAFFLYRDGVMTRNEGAIRPEPPDWSLHC